MLIFDDPILLFWYQVLAHSNVDHQHHLQLLVRKDCRSILEEWKCLHKNMTMVKLEQHLQPWQSMDALVTFLSLESPYVFMSIKENIMENYRTNL
mmetsp:Transcript_7405/g.9601  ORF Transcript_7405/g.9601 Transcript_7405/m.9601 type:complete len:95 (-) Transcript_7405:1310-1594(-)